MAIRIVIPIAIRDSRGPEPSDVFLPNRTDKPSRRHFGNGVVLFGLGRTSDNLKLRSLGFCRHFARPGIVEGELVAQPARAHSDSVRNPRCARVITSCHVFLLHAVEL